MQIPGQRTMVISKLVPRSAGDEIGGCVHSLPPGLLFLPRHRLLLLLAKRKPRGGQPR